MDKALKETSKKLGLELSLDIKAGEKGIYRGEVDIEGKTYCVMEQENRQAKLVPADEYTYYRENKEIVVKKEKNYLGIAEFKAAHPKSRERGMDISFGDL